MADGLRFSDFTITYDLDCVSEEYSTPSVMMFTFTFLEFVIEISRNHLEKKILPTISFSSFGTFSTEQSPNNAYTQMIAKEMNPSRGTSPSMTQLTDSVTRWVEILQKFLEKSAAEVKFPELCYYCPWLRPWVRPSNVGHQDKRSNKINFKLQLINYQGDKEVELKVAPISLRIYFSFSRTVMRIALLASLVILSLGLAKASNNGEYYLRIKQLTSSTISLHNHRQLWEEKCF